MLKVGDILKKDKKDVNTKVKEAANGRLNNKNRSAGLDISSEDEHTSRPLRLVEKAGQPLVRISSNGSKKVQDYVTSTLELLNSDSKSICLVGQDKAIEKLVKVIEQIKSDYKSPLEIKITLARSEDLKPNQTKDCPIMQIVISK